MSNLEQRTKVLAELKTHQSVFAVGWDDEDDNQMTVSAAIDLGGSAPENLFHVVAENLADAIRGCAPENEETKRSFYSLCVVQIVAELLEKLGIEYGEIEGGHIMIRRYMRPAELAEEFGVSPDFVRDIVRCIRVNIRQRTRYSPDDLISSGKVVSVRTAAYMDAARHRAHINTNMEQFLPVYDPISTEIDLHLIEPQTVDIEGITAEVIQRIKSKLITI